MSPTSSTANRKETEGPAKSSRAVERRPTNYSGVLYSIVEGRRVLHCVSCDRDMLKGGGVELCPACGNQVRNVVPA